MKSPEVPVPGADGASLEAKSHAGRMEAEGGKGAASADPPLLMDRIFGVVGGGMALAALVLLLTGGLGQEDVTVIAAPPALELISPTPDESVEGALELVFRTQAALEPQPGGWGADGLHVHAEINGREVMPAASDIRSRPDGAYSWTIGKAPAGEATVRLRWSDLAHRPIEDGASPIVRIHIR